MRTLLKLKKTAKEITKGELDVAEMELNELDFQIKEAEKNSIERNTYLEGLQSQFSNLKISIKTEKDKLKETEDTLSANIAEEKSIEKQIETLQLKLKGVKRDISFNKEAITNSKLNLEKSLETEKQSEKEIQSIKKELQDTSSQIIKKGEEFNKKKAQYEKMYADYKEQERNKEIGNVPLLAGDSRGNSYAEKETIVETQPNLQVVETQVTPVPTPVQEQPKEEQPTQQFVVRKQPIVRQEVVQPVIEEIAASVEETQEECQFDTLKSNIISLFNKNAKKQNGERFVVQTVIKNIDSLTFEFEMFFENGDEKSYSIAVSNDFVLSVYELFNGVTLVKVAEETENGLSVTKRTTEETMYELLQTACDSISFQLNKLA